MDRFLLPLALVQRQKEQKEVNYEADRKRRETERVNETGYGSDSMQNGRIVRFYCGNRSRQEN